MQTVVTARAALEADLRHALRHDEFLLHFQPQVDRDGGVTGAEALIRWQSASARPGDAGDLHPDRRRHRPDPADGPLGAGAGLRAAGALGAAAGAGRARASPSTSARASCASPASSTKCAPCWRSAGAGAAAAQARDHRKPAGRRYRDDDRHHAQPEGARRRLLARRFRHRLFVAQLPEAPAARPAEDRPLVRQRRAGRYAATRRSRRPSSRSGAACA